MVYLLRRKIYMINEYEQGQNDMLALIKDVYYKADKETFERLLDTEDENEVRNFFKNQVYQSRNKNRTRCTLNRN